MSEQPDALTGPDLEKAAPITSWGFREDPKTRDEFLRLAHNGS
ncbi:MAG: hypothetical protein QOD05_802, partial [Microbacteriaceae bacterium]|nr:hypothetical protein [Microbacteriaceae bacterium]